MFDNFPQIESENLLLRQIKHSDVEAVFRLFADQEVLKYHDASAITNITQAQTFINRWIHGFEKQYGIRWGITKKEDNIIIGTCGYSWNKSCFAAEIGYELAQEHWQQGIMTEALKTVINFGFKKMELNRIQATVMLQNIASIKLLKKLGFVEEGILREYGFWKDKFHNLKMFALLKKDYS